MDTAADFQTKTPDIRSQDIRDSSFTDTDILKYQTLPNDYIYYGIARKLDSVYILLFVLWGFPLLLPIRV